MATGEHSGWCCPTHCIRRRFDCWAWRWTACAVVTDELQAEFIYEHVKGAKVVAGMRVGSVGIHDDVGVVHAPSMELHEEPAVVASCLV